MAHTKTSIIEINGRRYDAQTGQALDVPVQQLVVPVISSTKAKASRQPAPHSKAHQPQRAQTLMRRSVHKPIKTKSALHAHSHTGSLAQVPSITVAPKSSVSQVHQGRLFRARQTSKSQAIQRYMANHQAATPVVASHAHVTTAKVSPSVSEAIVAKPKSASQVVFDRALAHADAHQAKPFNPKKHAREQRKHARHLKRAATPFYRRGSTVGLVSFSAIAIISLVALQYRPSLTLHMASTKAGFSASLPGFRPAGFGYGSFSYQPGMVGIQFKDTASNRTFNLRQESSNWDSQTLLTSQVTNLSRSYQALQVAGRTIYIYGQNNASWVDKGILYQLTSNGSLSTNDVLNIASSI